MGPEAIAQYISPTEFIQRLAAASGIDTLNLIKDPATMESEMQQAQQQQMSQTLMSQAGQLAKSPIAEQFLANGTQPPTGAPEETPEALPEG
jgi:sensor histidine kinase regulating citrate/malate metabolism